MSRFGWAYVNDVITGSGGSGSVPGGSDKAIQFASGSSFSGSTNLTFDYNTNTVRLTGTLYADNLIVSSSQILKSGSTIFGDSAGDTHQFTGSIYGSSALVIAGASTIGGTLDVDGKISGTTGQFTTITSQNSTINNSATIKNGLVVTGTVSASSFVGDGSGLTNVPPSLYTTKYLQTFIPSPNSLQITTIPYNQAVIKNTGGGSIQGNGASSIISGSFYGDLTTGNTIDTTDNTATYLGWNSGLDNDHYTSSMSPTFRTRIRTDGDINNISIFAGLRKSSIVGAGSTIFTTLTGSSGEYAIGVAYITSSTLSTNGKWILYTESGTPTTRTNTEVAVSGSTVYDITISWTSSSATATINGVSTSTTGTIPNDWVSPYIAVSTLTGSSVKRIYFAGYDVRY